jgi:hypothetical protein
MRHDFVDEARALEARQARIRVKQTQDVRAHRRAAAGFHVSILTLFVVVALLVLAGHHFLPLR